MSAILLGVDLGASKILAVALDERGEVRARRRVQTRREEGPERVLERVAEAAREAAAEATGTPEGLGVGCAGLVDRRRGIVLSSIMLPGWSGFPLREALSRRAGLPVEADNDANAALLGELRARAFPRETILGLTVGTGIGGAIAIEGALYRGALGTAGEFGNTTIAHDGPRCWCGNRGCLNALASGDAIEARARSLSPPREGEEPPTVRSLARAAAAGDGKAQEILRHAGALLGAGIANLVNVFNPDRVLLSGGVAEAGGVWLEALREEVARRALAEPAAHAKVERARLGYDAGAIGAAALLLEERR
ncbi:MAG TPA: ROK family protein [Planctomycetota bacterium]|nr:ROK family protein [Planctomycetota bacterium]